MRRTVLLLFAVLLLVPAAAASAKAPTLYDVEDEVMCVTCNVPLNIAESPQADAERDFIRAQIEQGKSKEQIKDALVAEYGSKVLGLPEDDGFGFTAYAIPIGLGILLIGVLAFLVPRWRRRSGAKASAGPLTPALSPADTARLDEDLARYDA